MALIVLIPACATQTNNVASSHVQAVLVQSGFKVRTATTPQQRQRLQRLPEHQFTAVKQNEENFYVWADKPNNQLYCGNEQAYRAYKEYRLPRMGAVSRVVIAVPNEISPNHRESRAPQRA